MPLIVFYKIDRFFYKKSIHNIFPNKDIRHLSILSLLEDFYDGIIITEPWCPFWTGPFLSPLLTAACSATRLVPLVFDFFAWSVNLLHSQCFFSRCLQQHPRLPWGWNLHVFCNDGVYSIENLNCYFQWGFPQWSGPKRSKGRWWFYWDMGIVIISFFWLLYSFKL